MPGHYAHFLSEFARIEIHHQLAGKGIEADAVAFNDDVSAVRKDAQFIQGSVRIENPFSQRGERPAQAICGNSVFGQLLNSAKANEIVKIVKAGVLLFARGDQTQSIPIVQLLRRQIQYALDFVPAKSVS
jgi:hypothetical protein